MRDSDRPDKSLEEILAEVEELVARLEGGDLPLEESIKLFEQGTVLCREGHSRLDAAESKIEALLSASGDGDGETVPLDAVDDQGA